jgi:hypothetical protein
METGNEVTGGARPMAIVMPVTTPAVTTPAVTTPAMTGSTAAGAATPGALIVPAPDRPAATAMFNRT